MFEKNKIYSTKKLKDHFGGNIQSSMPIKNGNVLYCKFDSKIYPEFPDEAWIEVGPLRKKAAEIIIRQKISIPVFKKKSTNQWEYLGKASITNGTNNTKLNYINKSPPRSSVQIILKFNFG